MKIMTINKAQDWNNLIQDLPGAHALQAWEWGQVKSHFGWQPHPLIWQDAPGKTRAAALVLERKIPVGGFAMRLSILYIPRGPLLDWSNRTLVRDVLDDLQAFARQQNAIFVKIDPDLPLGYGVPGEGEEEKYSAGIDVRKDLMQRKWLFSNEQIQYRNTVVVDLEKEDEEAMLMRMKSKTRYNIRLAKRRGVTVRAGSIEDIDLLYSMYAHTAVRDDFLIRGKDYFQRVWETFFNAGMAEPLIAQVEGKPVGAVVIFRFAKRAWYIHGMSLDEHREKMFNYRLQWEAMRLAKASGCVTYDMWGAPDTFTRDDPMWGVYRFKDGFGGRVVRTLGAWDYPTRPLFYRLYTQILPRILGWMRKRGKSQTKRSLSA